MDGACLGLRETAQGMRGPFCDGQGWDEREGDCSRPGGQLSLCHHIPVQNTKEPENTNFTLGLLSYHHAVYAMVGNYNMFYLTIC